MSEENKTELKRSLRLVDATSLVAGSMIGSGIFIVTSAMARGWFCCLVVDNMVVTGFNYCSCCIKLW
jgi:amino acid permease